jgi:hypothetical protein
LNLANNNRKFYLNMRLLITFMSVGALALTQFSTIHAQCAAPQAKVEMGVNNIRTNFSTSGRFHEEGFVYQPNPQSPLTVYTAGLWLGGADLAGNIRLAAVGYLANRPDFYAGPLGLDGTTNSFDCGNWDRLFTTTKTRVLAMRANLDFYQSNPAAAVTDFPDIMGWPGRGNAFFAQVNGFDLPLSTQVLAPFFDVDNNGQYDPLVGDFPVVELQGKAPFLPDQMVWSVFNDQGGPHLNTNGAAIGVEVQLTAWAFGEQAGAPLSNTVFTSHKIISRSLETIADFRIGMWADFDLGCYLDDYVGCDSTRNYFYTHNQDPVDGQPGVTCNGTPTFGDSTPVQSCTFLNKSMDHFMVIDNAGVGIPPAAITDPTQVIEYYNYLRGFWRDGTPLTVGGTGYNPGSTALTNYAFPSDPSDPNGWSMCSSNLSFGDRRTLAIHSVGDLFPGAVHQLDLAWTFHPYVPQPCNLGNVPQDVDLVQEAYDDGFAGLTPVKNIPSATVKLVVSPNPAQEVFTVAHQSVQAVAIRCLDLQGRVVYEQLNPGTQLQVHVNHWPAGTYVLQLISQEGIATERVVVAR